MTHLPYTLPTTLPGDTAGEYAVTADATGGGAGTLRALVSHCQAAVDLLIAQYRDQDQPLIRAWLCAYLDRLQDIDTATASLYENALDLDNAEGVHLDLLGRIVREAREGRTDTAYRNALRVRVLVNRSQGTVADLIGIADLFEGGDPEIQVREYQPARVTVAVLAVAVNSPEALHTRLRRAKAAGVALQTITHPAPTPSATRVFRLGNGAASLDTANVTTGLGWTGDTRGGYLGHVLA